MLLIYVNKALKKQLLVFKNQGKPPSDTVKCTTRNVINKYIAQNDKRNGQVQINHSTLLFQISGDWMILKGLIGLLGLLAWVKGQCVEKQTGNIKYQVTKLFTNKLTNEFSEFK